MDKTHKYLKFLHLAQAIRQMTTFPALDAVEERLLNICASAWHSGREITVMEAMTLAPEISETTAYRRLKSLKGKGMLNLEYGNNDGRTRFVVPTDLARRYFDELANCIDKANKN